MSNLAPNLHGKLNFVFRVTNLTYGCNTSKIDINSILFMFYQFYPLASYIIGKASSLPCKTFFLNICNEENKVIKLILLKKAKLFCLS